MIGVPTYRRTGSALHAVRPAVGISYCVALAAPALLLASPLALAGVLVATIGAAAAARVGGELRRAAKLAVPLALLVAALNPLVSQQGLTVLADGPAVPLLGNVDVTLEAVVFGLVAGLRVVVVMLVFALYSASVDPDGVLRLAARVAPRSALTATLATRAVPVLGRDGRRLAEAYGLRASAGPALGRGGRLRRAATLTRALGAGALERSVELAAALEVRGYGALRRFAPGGMPWSRGDTSFALAAAALVALCTAGLLASLDGFQPYPLLKVDAGPVDAALATAVPLLALAPFVVAARERARAHRSADG